MSDVDRAVIANRNNSRLRPAGEEPVPTATTGEGGALAVVELQRNGEIRSPLDPVHTVRAGGHHHALLVTEHYTPGRTYPAGERACGPVTTTDHHSLVVPYYSSEGTLSRVADRDPVGAISTRDRFGLVVPQYTGETRARDAGQEPTGAIATHGKLALVVPGTSGRDFNARRADLETVPTLTGSAHKAVLWTDGELDACGYRMFDTDIEISAAMAMAVHPNGERYVVLGNQTERMKQYGNSVTPPAMAWLVSRLIAAGIDVSRVIDLFCGAGGSSIGAELAGAMLVLGLNHWPTAVKTHATNFQHADHDCQDISSLDTTRIKAYIRHARPTVMIAGPECTNHTKAKGGARVKPQAASLFEDGPAGDEAQDKSRATMWDVIRFAEQAILAGAPLEAIVVENVTDAFNWGENDDGGLFDAWLYGLKALGYEHEIVWLNSMFAPPAPNPAPQSRDRMYVVLWRKGIKMPSLKVEPPAYCPACDKIVAGQQALKKPGSRFGGSYGQQYVYLCPGCHGTALPGAYPAATIIDESIPTPRIAERTPTKCQCCGKQKLIACNTRERLRRGLIRTSNEPWEIRMPRRRGGTPKPGTLPLVHLPHHADDRVVLPVAGNTFERTPGNRARRARDRPLDVVHGTLDRALVVPPMGGVAPRPAATDPAPTQTTTTRAAVLQPREGS